MSILVDDCVTETAECIDIHDYQYMSVHCPCGYVETYDLYKYRREHKSRYWRIPDEFWQHVHLNNWTDPSQKPKQ